MLFWAETVLFQVHASQRDPGENGPVHPLTPNSTGVKFLFVSLPFHPPQGKHSNPRHGLWQTANTATLLFYGPCHSGDLEVYCITQVIKVQVSSKFYSWTKFQQENTVTWTLCTLLEMSLVLQTLIESSSTRSFPSTSSLRERQLNWEV